jgi:hypothetical protein
MKTTKTYEFIITKLDGQFEIQSKECKFPLNTSLFSKLFRLKCGNEILELEVKDKENTIYKSGIEKGEIITAN